MLGGEKVVKEIRNHYLVEKPSVPVVEGVCISVETDEDAVEEENISYLVNQTYQKICFLEETGVHERIDVSIDQIVTMQKV